MADVLRQLGKPQEAMVLYEQALLTKQQLGDVRGVAVTQNAMANVLVQLGKPQEAMALYEQALLTAQQLGDVRGVAVTQHAMADVLVDLGKPQEAMALYQQALLTKQQLGDVRGVAVTQANFSQLLLEQGEYKRALSMAWDAYSSLSDHGYTRDTQFMQQLLISIKGWTLGPERFDALWKQVMSDPQPAWLRDVQASSSTEDGHIPSKTLDVIASNTITVMSVVPEKLDEWRETMTGALKQAQDAHQAQEAEFFTAVLAILDGQVPVLPDGHPYSAALDTIQAGIAAGGSEGEDSSDTVSEELMQAVRDFVNAKDWDATRQVVETRQAMLFRPVVEALFEQNIAKAKADGEERAAGMLEQHLTILRACKAIGIAETFEQLASLAGDSQEDALPFDSELIPRSVAALLGGPQEKMAHAQYLMALANETTDEEVKAFIQVIQLALFSNDLSQLGGDLKGAYRQGWEVIITGVKAGGVDLEMFEIIASNTVAVLGPAAAKRSEWRDNLAALRNQATAKGDRNMLALLNAVIGLLDAGGDASGLGDGLTGVYEKTWLAIVEKLQ
jgi:hypothetical protein